MPWSLEDRFRIPENSVVLAFIESQNPSAHDEVASMLTSSARGLRDVGCYCPDLHAYAYVVLHTRSNRIFGIAYGMSALAFRLPKAVITEALADGGSNCAEIGGDWISVTKHVDVWCKRAHGYVVSDHFGTER
ncbi:MAG: hypothetical protein EXS31_16875 [Pedosphaera sp.]|nr:hypothetical protein [Pedosphaera sp.]